MTNTPTHHWIHGGLQRDRLEVARALSTRAQLVAPLDAHRRLRGPYTATGALMRAIVPAAAQDLISRHDIELLSAAPELSEIVPNSRETLTSMAIPAERTRFYARLRTTRIANGLVEFVAGSLPDSPRTLVFDNVDQADETDLEFLTALLRRVDPAALTVIVCSANNEIPNDALRGVLATHAREQQATASISSEAVLGNSARQYVQGDCTSDDPRLILAYEALSHAARADLHDQRAAELVARNEQSLRLGAIPYHLEHGSDAAGAGTQALYDAQDYCVCLGYFAAVIDYGYRALELIDPRAQEPLWWMVTIELTLALSIMSRTEEAELLYDQARLLSTNPIVHMAAAYSTAMLYTRHNDPENRNEQTAKRWLNSAIAMASLVEEPTARSFQSAFYKNGLALVEVNLGDRSEALRLVNECIDGLDQELAPDEHVLHRTVLKNNRARVYSSLGRFDEALADYAIVIGADPNHAEHYLERAGILRKLGRIEEAFDDYTAAIRLSPPFPEIYYNRGDLRAEDGDTAGALEDFAYVIELDPEFIPAYVNSAGLRLELGDLDGAYNDALAGLTRDRACADLEVVVGQVHMAREEQVAARQAFDRALAIDTELVVALAARAELAFALGEVDAAVSDLRTAVELSPTDASLRYNLAFVYQGAGCWDEALADLNVALELAPQDEEILAARDDCERQLLTI